MDNNRRLGIIIAELLVMGVESIGSMEIIMGHMDQVPASLRAPCRRNESDQERKWSGRRDQEREWPARSFLAAMVPV